MTWSKPQIDGGCKPLEVNREGLCAKRGVVTTDMTMMKEMSLSLDIMVEIMGFITCMCQFYGEIVM